MDLFVTTFESVAVLLGIGILGFWLIQRRIMPGSILSLLSPLALEIALPSLIFINIIQDFDPTVSPDWWQLPVWWMFFTGIAAALTCLLMFLAKKETRSEFAVSLFYQNGIFFPLAILAGMFGDNSQYIPYLFIFTLFYPAFFFSTYRFFFKSKKTLSLDWKKIIHPVLIVTIIALIFRLSDAQMFIPDVIIRILILLGGMTIPLIMIILGGNIYVDYKKQGNIQIVESLKFVLCKNIIFPLVFLGVLLLIRPAFYIALLIIIQAAVPPVTAVPLVTERAGGNRGIVNQYIVASFASSLITIPVILALFSHYFSL